MRTVMLLFLGLTTLSLFSQPNRKPKMAAVFAPGYYINLKNDTVKCQIQINPEDPTEFYRQFAFIAGKTKRPKVMKVAQIRAYGFDGRDFVRINDGSQKLYAERLTMGRLRFYEYQHNGKINGYPAIESEYFIRDTFAEGEKSALGEPAKVSHKFYKKALKPYFQDQPMLWSDLDKYDFNKDKVVQTINEFNQFYAARGN
ncbi:MAG: hypothetical protein JNL60_01575 [Bacteroidia bacterium]|nr:hypothetical protein [Bacteroidia bacterium]